MAQKVEVVADSGRRRRFTDQDKARIVAETLEPGETVAGVARRHGISQSLLFGWRKAMRTTRAGGSDCLPVSGSAADTVRQIEAELAACRQSLPPGRKRIRASDRLRGLIAAGLASGLSPTVLAKLTEISRTTIKSWQGAALPDAVALLPPPRELVVVDAVRSPSPPAASGSAFVRVGSSVTIEMPVESLTEAVLRALIAAGGGR